MDLLKIKPIPTKKKDIPLRPLMEKKIIPKHPFRLILNGTSGSGKSTVLLNLMTKPQFYKDYFDDIYLIAPTAEIDDSFEMLKIKEDHMITNGDISKVEAILENQKENIKKKGIAKAPKTLLIFEDSQSTPKLLRSKEFLRIFIAGRHYGISTILTSQSFTKTPRGARLQATDVIYFPSSMSENMIMVEEFSPPNFTKKDMLDLINFATVEPYSFLYINMTAPIKERYRKNLDQILELN
jgi:hypothetical protein